MQSTHKVVLLRSAVRYADGPLSFGRATLFFDRIELVRWRYLGRRTRSVFLASIQRVEWRTTASSRTEMILHVRDADPIRMYVRQARHWKQTLDQRLKWTTAERMRGPLQDGAMSLGEVALYGSSLS